jgi:hypothetical protein
VLLDPSHNVIADADIELAFGVPEHINAVQIHRVFWLRGRDLNPRSGSCRIMGHFALSPWLLDPSHNVIADADIELAFGVPEHINAVQIHRVFWLRGRDLNPRPSGYEPDELPGCSTPRLEYLDLNRERKCKNAFCSYRRSGCATCA